MVGPVGKDLPIRFRSFIAGVVGHGTSVADGRLACSSAPRYRRSPDERGTPERRDRRAAPRAWTHCPIHKFEVARAGFARCRTWLARGWTSGSSCDEECRAEEGGGDDADDQRNLRRSEDEVTV